MNELLHKEWDDYKWTLPTSRFFGYIEHINKAYTKQIQTTFEKKVQSLKELEGIDG